jgi:hypothetical protein
MKRDLLYALTCLCFSIMIGGAVYEHLTIVPKWSAAPPLSLSMFQGTYGLKPELFWKLIHPVTLALFALTLFTHWKTERRKNILTALSSYFLILVITAFYFVPELLAITTTPFAQKTDPDLTRRAGAWEMWSLVRLGVLLLLAMQLFLGLAKSGLTTRKTSENQQKNLHHRNSEMAIDV